MRYAILAAAALCCLTGCASTGLVHDKNYVRAAAVDTSDGVTVTFAFFADQEPVSVTGDSVDDALEAAQLRTGKQLFTGYTELIILNTESAAGILEHMLEDWKVSPSCAVAYCANGEKLLLNEPPEVLRGSLSEAVRMNIAPECDIVTVLEKLLNSGEAEVITLTDHGASGTAAVSS